MSVGVLAVLPGCTSGDGKNPVSDDTGKVDSVTDTDTGADTDSDTDTNDCDVIAVIESPHDGDTFTVGDTVNLDGDGNGGHQTWLVDGVEVDSRDTGGPAAWVATEGVHTVHLTVEKDCGTADAEIGISVVAPTVTVYGSELGLSDLSVKGLSAGADGSLWAATMSGLIHVDPEADTARVYTTADGLYKDTPYAVLAHSDGTLWVGDVGDVDRQGSHFSLNGDGSLSLIEIIDFTESTEIQYALRLREQPFGVGAGDVWMGTNEGLCVWDADLGVFSEHAHPTHPHSLSYGVAFTPDGNIWNGDQYQLSRWDYSYDGDLSPSADLAEYWVPWPVDVEQEVGITDIDAEDWTLWVASYLYGVARVDVGTDVGTSTTTLLGDPFPTSAAAIRADGDGHVWIGTTSGLLVWDTATETMTDLTSYLPDPSVQQLTVDPTSSPPTMWAGTAAGFVRFVGIP